MLGNDRNDRIVEQTVGSGCKKWLVTKAYKTRLNKTFYLFLPFLNFFNYCSHDNDLCG